ncbi:FAD-dependent monooxygenase [Rhizobium tubonense]|uniref:2-polyprenyl-6-methoxyphenol hydroxylase n=1 Tax=Rhizobium tubonense TaxID=484088 RepID=A0A2W4C4N7_9HYPH|nr:FAD-dependent monooxygenase [Rhizobium tubonense]PZM08021.1 2-polyprenyl-6-methoxyphenol hydroxylase [Rhizobium tubonense]
MRSLRIRIIGGSLAGLFSAILLRRDGHDVKVYERSTEGLGGRGAGLVAQEDLFSILRLLGLEQVADVGVVAKERIYLDKKGHILQTISMPQMQISWDYLYNTIASHIDRDHYLLGRQVTHVRDGDDGVEIFFADGSSEAADLVIGADGIGSVVRKSLHPNAYENSYAGYVAWRGLMSETQLPREAAVLLNRFAFYVTPGNHVLGYLVPGPNGEMEEGSRRYNWVWYRKVSPWNLAAVFTARDGRQNQFSLPRGELTLARRDELRLDATEQLPPQFAYAVKAEETPSIQGIFDYEAPRMIGKSTVLVGDAAFIVRPHTAMGASKAAGDVMVLANVLKTSDDLSAALRQFEQDRIGVGRQIAAYGRRLGGNVI